MDIEQVTEHLGFAPISFVDALINKVNATLVTSLEQTEKKMLESFTREELEGVHKPDTGASIYRIAI